MDPVVTIFIFIMGVCVGSFLNVVAMRYIKEESVGGRSYCTACHKTLCWWELIPLFSFLFLVGKCSKCRKPVSWQYPLVELATGLLFVGVFSSIPLNWVSFVSSLVLAIILSLLVILFLIDWHIFILPDIYIVALSVLVIVLLFIQPNAPSFFSSLGGILIGSGFLFLLWIITHRQGIGFGDVKLLVPLGALLGTHGTIVLLWMSFSAGGLVGLYLLARGKAHLKTPLPFGPFLTVAAVILLLFPHLTQAFFSITFGMR